MNFSAPERRLTGRTNNSTSIQMKKVFNLAVLALGLVAWPVLGQVAVPPPAPDYQPLSPQQLDQLLAPIALYPDPLMAQILPASTLPTEIVMADRYVSGGGDPNLADQQPWDPSVQALVRYPTVLQWLDDNLTWTTELGAAFVNQQQDVMDSIQRLRTDAYNVGNLQTTPQQQVVNDSGDIEILPADPDMVYLPDYQPDDVYYQSGYGLTFGVGFPIGVWLDGDFDWHHRHLITWDHDHPRPHDWWHERPDQRARVFAEHTTVWHPSVRPGVMAAHPGGDRGWNNPVGRSPGLVVGHPEPRPREVPELNRPKPEPVPVIHRAEPVQRVAPAPVEHFEPSRSASSGAFLGIQSSHDTRTFSDRGQQSMQTVTHSAPAPSFGGGGGGGHVSGGGGGGNSGGGRR
jgi:hypothetical protein